MQAGPCLVRNHNLARHGLVMPQFFLQLIDSLPQLWHANFLISTRPTFHRLIFFYKLCHNCGFHNQNLQLLVRWDYLSA